MFYKNAHLSDQELLLSADGELAQRRQKQVQRHLQSCWMCRRRMAELEKTIGEVVDCYESMLENETLPGNGSEALLRARLASASVAAGGHHANLTWYGFAAGLFLIVTMSGLLLKGQPARVVPNPRLTPGEAIAVSKSEICEAKQLGDNQDVPENVREAVFAEYGLNNAQRTAYEVDFLITPALGGAASIRNLWPEPYNSRVWNAHTKDVLERRLHTMVCRGEIELSTAQHDIAANWMEAYKKYVGPENPM